MAVLIARLRRMISDKDVPLVFSDDDLGDILDGQQFVERYLPIEGTVTYKPGGGIEWHDFYAQDGDWEDGVVFVTIGFEPVAPTTSDLRVGHWTFDAPQLPTIYLTGKNYDLYGAAADALEQWAAIVKRKYDVQSADQKLMRSQQSKAMLDLAETYREKQRPQRLTMVRSDVN